MKFLYFIKNIEILINMYVKIQIIDNKEFFYCCNNINIALFFSKKELIYNCTYLMVQIKNK